MKIAILHCFYRYPGGEDLVVSQQYMLLQKLGFEVYSFFRYAKNFSKILTASFYIFDFFVPVYTFLKLLYLRFVNKVGVVIIHNHFYLFSPLIFPILSFLGFKVVLTIHNNRLSYNRYLVFQRRSLVTIIKQMQTNISRFFFYFFELDTYISAVVFPSKSLRKEYGKMFTSSSTTAVIIPPVVEVSPDQYFMKERSDFYLYVGRISEEKGIELLVEVFNNLDTTLVVAGDGPLLKSYINGQKKGKYSNCVFLGSLDKSSIRYLVAKTKCLIVPSEWNEPFGMVVVEAMQQQTLLLLSNQEIFRELTKDYLKRCFFERGSKTSLVAAIKNVIDKGVRFEELDLRRELDSTLTLKYYLVQHLKLLQNI